MKVEPESADGAEAPPLFKTWPRAYWFVAGFFFVELVLLYAFTRFYS